MWKTGALLGLHLWQPAVCSLCWTLTTDSRETIQFIAEATVGIWPVQEEAALENEWMDALIVCVSVCVYVCTYWRAVWKESI